MPSPHDPTHSEMEQTLELLQSGGGKYYFLREDEGVLTSKSQEHGAVFNLWREFELALEFCQAYNEKNKTAYRVAHIDNRDLPVTLKMLQGEGDKYIQLHTSAETSKVIPIDRLLEMTERTIKEFNSIGLQTDEFVCLWEDRRAAGLDPIDEIDKVLPVDCGNCAEFFWVDVTVYREWRRGEKTELLCPHCHCAFREGRWGYVRCKTCSAYSGMMPLSYSEHLRRSDRGWRCRKCEESAAQVRIEKIIQKDTISAPTVGPTGKTGSPGCLSVVFITLLVTFLIILQL